MFIKPFIEAVSIGFNALTLVFICLSLILFRPPRGTQCHLFPLGSSRINRAFKDSLL